ncbi:MAG: hypothetical protein QOJ51_1737 [Acidobacteriaceae bacterium]|jgi:hypothetical protein|nr:hypothetical protein [Acidobacteriaceae bacterium]
MRNRPARMVDAKSNQNFIIGLVVSIHSSTISRNDFAWKTSFLLLWP